MRRSWDLWGPWDAGEPSRLRLWFEAAIVKTAAETTVGEVVARLLAFRRTGIRRVVFRDGADPGSDFMVALGGE